MRIKIIFTKLIQDLQEIGGSDDYMVSRVFFELYRDGEQIGTYTADLKQVIGGNVEQGDIEVGPPQGYNGPFNQEEFAGCARKYFGGNIGSRGTGIRISGGSGNTMRNNEIGRRQECEFDV